MQLFADDRQMPRHFLKMEHSACDFAVAQQSGARHALYQLRLNVDREGWPRNLSVVADANSAAIRQGQPDPEQTRYQKLLRIDSRVMNSSTRPSTYACRRHLRTVTGESIVRP